MKTKSLFNNSIWNMGFNVWQMVIIFITTPLYIKELGTAQYGIFVLLSSITGFMGLMNFGLGDATLRYVSFYRGRNDSEGIQRIIRSTFFVYIIISLISVILLYLLAPKLVVWLSLETNYDFDKVIEIIKITAFTVGLSFFSSAFQVIPQAFERYDINTIVNIGISFLQSVGILAILYLQPTLHNLVMWNLLIAFFTIFIFFGLAKYFIKDLNFLPSYDVKSMREVFSFSIYSFVSHIFALLHTQADRIILTSLAGPTSVGYLAVPQQLNSRASYAVNSSGSVLFPRFSAMSDNEIKKVSLFLNSGWALLVLSVLIFVPMTVLSPSFLELWINKEFAEKISFLTQVISASFIISGVYNSYAHLFNGTGKPQYQTIVISLIGIFSTLVNIILINKFGFQGLGYAYWVTPIIGLVALVFAWKFVLNQKTLSPLISIFYSPLLSAAFSSYIISKILEIIPIHHWSYFVMYALFTLLLISGIIIIIEYTILKNHSRLKIILSKWKNK